MRKLLSIGQAAKLLGLQVDTVRKLERAGRIRAVWSAGGHRRFTPEEIDRYRAARQKGSRPKSAPRPVRRAAPAHQPARHPASGEFTAPTPVRPAYVAPPPPQPAPQAVPSPARPSSDPFAAYRLEDIKRQGRAAIPWGTPAEWQGKVIAELERFVTPIQFPASLWANKATEIVRARVAEVLRPYREAQEKAARERKAAEEKAEQDARLKAESDRRRSALIRHGNSYAFRETLSWGSAGYEARAEVERVLARDVVHDLTELEVESLVDDVLDEWKTRTTRTRKNEPRKPGNYRRESGNGCSKHPRFDSRLSGRSCRPDSLPAAPAGNCGHGL